MDAAELCFTPATELIGMIRSRKISPVELTQVVLDRIQAIDPKIRAYITVIPELALQTAREREKELMGKDPLGPLHPRDPDHLGMSPLQGFRPRRRCAGRPADQEGGSDSFGKDQHSGVRNRHQCDQRNFGNDPESLGSIEDGRRIQRRRRSRPGGGARSPGGRDGHGGFDPPSGQLLWNRRPAAFSRGDSPLPELLGLGYHGRSRADGAHHVRSCPSPIGHGRTR